MLDTNRIFLNNSHVSISMCLVPLLWHIQLIAHNLQHVSV